MDKSQLPFLLRLVDDPSSAVRAKVATKLREFGPGLLDDAVSQGITLTERQRHLVQEIIGSMGSSHAVIDWMAAPNFAAPSLSDEELLRETWLDWLQLPDNHERLESALALISCWQLGRLQTHSLGDQLDELAKEFLATGLPISAEHLCGWLFGERGLSGASAHDYYNPLNSNLIHVIESGQGIPISLTAIFMLVGKRLGLQIHGCNFPGHFLARSRRDSGAEPGGDLFFDCFNGGRLLSDAEALAVRKAAPAATMAPATAVTMIARFLRNIAVAYEQSSDKDKALFILALLGELEQATERGA